MVNFIYFFYIGNYFFYKIYKQEINNTNGHLFLLF